MKQVKLEYTQSDGKATSKTYDVLSTIDSNIQAFVTEFELYTTNTVTAAYKRGEYEEVSLEG